MNKERLLELAGLNEGMNQLQPRDLGKLLSVEQRGALASLVDGTLNSMGESEKPEEYEFWLKILHALGHGHSATEWRKSLEGEGILTATGGKASLSTRTW